MKDQASEPYQPHLLEALRDPCEAAEYLNAVLEEGDVNLLLLALKNVAEANGGLDQLPRKIHFTAA
ncbi:MAG: hypothetical protein AB1656_22150 [Candidatus Omnitrophota bacterium]